MNIDCCNSNIIQCYQLQYLHLCLQSVIRENDCLVYCLHVLYLSSTCQQLPNAKCTVFIFSKSAGQFFDHSESMCMTSWVTEDKKHDIISNVCLFYLIHTCKMWNEARQYVTKTACIYFSCQNNCLQAEIMFNMPAVMVLQGVQ